MDKKHFLRLVSSLVIIQKRILEEEGAQKVEKMGCRDGLAIKG